MSFIQRLISVFLKADTVDKIKAESESWIVTCPSCRTETSVWDLGGIRYKAASKGASTIVRCPNCSEKHMMPLNKRR